MVHALLFSHGKSCFFGRRSIEEEIMRRSAVRILKNGVRNQKLWSIEVGGPSKKYQF